MRCGVNMTDNKRNCNGWMPRHKGNSTIKRLLELHLLMKRFELDILNDEKEQLVSEDEIKSDNIWVSSELNNLKNGGWLTAVKMKVANEMWGKYGN